MNQLSRRNLLQAGAATFLATGGAQLLLGADVKPTAETKDLHDYLGFLREAAPAQGAKLTTELPVTGKQMLGPYHRPGAPFRGKVTPPLEPGRVLVVRGRVWGVDTKKPLSGAVLDVWQANASGHYDMSHPDYPEEKGVFLYRIRLLTDETGYYEFETVFPGRYKVGPTFYRPAHIHYWARANGYRELVTQLYFKGDPYNGKERGFDNSLVHDVKKHQRGKQTFETCDFDIVLGKA